MAMAGDSVPHNTRVTFGPGGDAVHVWWEPTDGLDPQAVERAAVALADEERACAARFRFAADRRDYVIAHDLLRRSLAACEASPVAPSFSLSHARGLVACAIAGGVPVGVDAERIDAPIAIDTFAQRFFSHHEVAALRRCPEPERPARLVELWTLKEAFAKAMGLGLTLDLDAASFDVGSGGAIAFTPPPGVDARTWRFAVFTPSATARVAVAVCPGLAAAPRFVVHDGRR
jgi:phosphopantetheinyl transferase